MVRGGRSTHRGRCRTDHAPQPLSALPSDRLQGQRTAFAWSGGMTNRFRLLATEYRHEEQKQHGVLPVNMTIAIHAFAKWLDERVTDEPTCKPEVETIDPKVLPPGHP